jgi:hypothetical protein
LKSSPRRFAAALDSSPQHRIKQTALPQWEGRLTFRERDLRFKFLPLYFGGAGVNPSRLRPGSGFGLGFGAFLTSFLPLSLLPIHASLPQIGTHAKDF